ncbi:MAG: phytoene desaturase family protein [Patescibacteria group bacterium]|nr:phytoene desaturase family protein [Patescibacteria group bacterium]
MNAPKTVAIIGGGIGGLATANLLAKAGYKVTIYESRHQLGGRMGLLERDGFRFDTGPSWYLMPEVYDNYLKLLGTSAAEQLQLTKLTPAYQVFLQDEPEPIVITGNETTDAATFEAREVGAGRALTRYLDSAERTYHLSQKHFLYTTFERPLSLARPDILRNGPAMLRAALQPIDKFVSKYVKELGLRQILEYPAVFLGSSPFTAPALYHLMSYLDFRQGVFYPQGGLYSVTEAFTKLGRELGVTYQLNTAVTAIEIADGVATGVRLASGEVAVADIVISNADMHFTQTKLLPAAAQDYPASYWQKRQAGPSALLMYLGVKGQLPQLQHHNLFFVKAWRQNFSDIFTAKDWPTPASIYVSKPSATDTSVAPTGHENVFVLVPLPANPGLHAKDLVSYADRYLNQIAEQAGIPDLMQRIVTRQLFGPNDFVTQYNAWNGTALGLSHELKQSALFRPKTRSKKVRNLYYVGANVQPGIGVPMCLISAELVYKQITGDRSSGRLLKPITNRLEPA